MFWDSDFIITLIIIYIGYIGLCSVLSYYYNPCVFCRICSEIIISFEIIITLVILYNIIYIGLCSMF